MEKVEIVSNMPASHVICSDFERRLKDMTLIGSVQGREDAESSR